MTTHTAARAALAARLPVTHADIATASTLKSNHIRGMRNILANEQGMTCAGCGETLIGARIELCHIIPAAYGKGIVPANVYAGCKECNDYDREECNGDAATIISRMVRPDLVATSHPDRQACLAASGNDRAATVRAARGSIG
jgi:hypothetical protein